MEFGTNNKLNFCIMTSANYLTKALVMYDSLQKVCSQNINFFYFAFDELTHNYLVKLNYDNIIPIPLNDLENFYPELVKTKYSRNKSEYFFTCTPHIIDYTLKNFDINHVTYLDADLYFYKDPKEILVELKNNSVLITEHRYYPEVKDHSSGKYCVQFLPVVNDDIGNNVIKWWREKCIDWCYLRAENGKWADQGYLNDWPERFENIAVMKNRGGGIANWNMDVYTFKNEKNSLLAFNKEINRDVNVIFYHFQGVKIYSNRIITLGGLLRKKKNVFEYIYKDYIDKLSDKENELIQKIGILRKEFGYPTYPFSQLRLLLALIRRSIFPKKTDIKFYYKYLNKYKWLP